MTDGTGWDPTGLKLLEAVAPLRDRVHELVVDARRVREEAGQIPAADSPAMGELSHESEYAGDWGADPFHLAYSLAGLVLASAEDHLDALVTLFSKCDETEHFYGPVYAHVTLARSVIETSARAAWLLESGVSYADRAARAVTELLYTRWERSQAMDDPTSFEALRVKVEAECTKRGLTLYCKDPRRDLRIGDVRRPGNRAAVQQLFAGKSPRFADLVYGYQSAIAHGVAWGLIESLESGQSQGGSAAATTTADLVRSSQSMITALLVAAEGYRTATAVRFEHMAWGSTRWTELNKQLEADVVERWRAG